MEKADYGYYKRCISLHELENLCTENITENRAEIEAKMLDIYHSLWYDYLTELRYNHNHDSKGRFCSGGGSVNANKSGSDKVTISAIEQPIEQQHTGKGNPNAILHAGRPLNNRQKELLEKLPDYDSRVIVPKKSVNMADLAALTAVTNAEYAMFTKGNKRLIIRGSHADVNIDGNAANELVNKGYKWSGHTHPGTNNNCLQASKGDYDVLRCFRQEKSVVYNSKGKYQVFYNEEW